MRGSWVASNLKKLKVVTVVGTRPEIIRLSRVIVQLDQYCEHTLVHTGQNYDYELSEIFFGELRIRKPDYFLNAAVGSSIQTIGKIIINIDDVLDKIKPDAMLVLGDTNSCLSIIPAKRKKIPTFHMEAGNRCFDERVPEEINRRIVDHTADINLTYSDIAREYLLSEGVPADRVIKTGSPMFEVLSHYKAKITRTCILEDIGLTENEYFLISAHREENIDNESQFAKFIELLNTLAERYSYPVIVSTHPRTRKRIEQLGISFNPLVNLMKPLGFMSYNRLQMSAKAVLSDSGTISEESSILEFPALNIRQAHERPEAMEEASVMMVGLDLERILQALELLNQESKPREKNYRPVADYSIPNVSSKVVRIIHSYTDYVNRVVWKKY